MLQPNVDIAGLLATGLTLDTASSAAAYSRVAAVDAQLSGGGHSMSLTASQVSSTCNDGASTASANLINPKLTVDGTSIALPAHPTAGQSFVFAAGTVTLNDQIPASGGGIEDQAVHMHFTGTSPAQDPYLAVTVCNAGSSSNTITVTNPGSQSNAPETPASLQIHAADSDPGQILAYAATGLPPGLSIDSAAGLISGAPTTATGSPFTVNITVTDTSGASGSATFTWAVTNVVTVINPGSPSGAVGSPAFLPMSATNSDPSIHTFTWSATGLPPGLSIGSAAGAITGTPTTGGSYTVHVTATDSTLASGPAAFTYVIFSFS